jgi:tyrosyl-tRNA synthetase
MIGDPSDKMAARNQLTQEEVLKNCKDYKKQVSNLIDFTGKNAAKLMYNSKWLSKMSFEDVLKLSSLATVQQMLKRDMFEKRIKEDKPIYIHEFLYPLMQGYDSVAMDVDLEIGGNDQTFNMLIGRDLTSALKNKEKFVLALKLLVDPSGKKAGKTEGETVNLTDSPADMFGKIMAWPDELIVPAFEILTDVKMSDIEEIKNGLGKGENPKNYKLRLAYEVTKIHKSEKEAAKAKEEFEKVFSEKQRPSEVKSCKLQTTSYKLIDLLVETKLARSKSEARRLIEQGGVKIDDVKKADPNEVIEIKKEIILQVGPRHFIKLHAG